MTLDASAQATAARDQLLNRVKAQYEPGPMRPRLCYLVEPGQDPESPLKLQWLAYAGMGDTMLMPAHEKDAQAATELLEQGRLVPTWVSRHYGDTIKMVEHFDDVRWARTEAGDVIIYNLSLSPRSADSAALAEGPGAQELLKRIEYKKVMEDTPIFLRTETGQMRVTPILTDKDAIQLRKRQIAYAEATLTQG